MDMCMCTHVSGFLCQVCVHAPIIRTLNNKRLGPRDWPTGGAKLVGRVESQRRTWNTERQTSLRPRQTDSCVHCSHGKVLVFPDGRGCAPMGGKVGGLPWWAWLSGPCPTPGRAGASAKKSQGCCFLQGFRLPVSKS